MLRVPFADLQKAIKRTLVAKGFTPMRAELCARIFAETTRDGVYTHGLNRLPRMLQWVADGLLDVHAEPKKVSGFGAIEQWDGQVGPGPLNAHFSMQRSIELARSHGIGLVTLRNTTHWMRGGTYGWQAADAGLFAICFTNTMPNLPAWGTLDPILGNNPMVLAIPRPHGANIVLDMAMSQFSYGTMSAYAKRGDPLPYPGGFDEQGKLSTDADEISRTFRTLPIGLWKGSGLAMALDFFASMLAGGLATNEIPSDPAREVGISQFFLAIDPANLGSAETMQQTADGIIANLRDASAIDTNRPPRYPGEQTLQLREENMRLGVPVEEEVWRTLVHS